MNIERCISPRTKLGKAVKQKAQELNIDILTMENIVLRYQEINRDNDGQIIDDLMPSDEYIQIALSGSNIVLSQDQIDIYNKLVNDNNNSNIFQFDTPEERDAFINDRIQPYFNRESIVIYSTFNDGKKNNVKYCFKLAEPTLKEKFVKDKTQQFGVELTDDIMHKYKDWLSQNKDGIVAFRVNKEKYNTREFVEQGIIGNPFSEQSNDPETVSQFYRWLVFGRDFGNEKATKEFRQAIIDKILATPNQTPVLYYKELGRPSHATVIGYLINNKHLLENRSSAPQNQDETINIFYSSGENADLSNFAERPFYPGSEIVKGDFKTVEGAFQAQKLAYSNAYDGRIYQGEAGEILKQLENADGATATKIGNSIKGLNKQDWDKVKFNTMKSLIRDSFKQNSNALQRLLDTGNATLTHNQAKGEWKTEFPRILMEVRNELRQEYDEKSDLNKGKDYLHHSGGAIGSDSVWDDIGNQFGIKSNHYYYGKSTPRGNVEISKKDYLEGIEHVKKANETMKRKDYQKYMNLLARNWIQVRESDAIFAISYIMEDGTVSGGTGWAVQMGIDSHKPVYVFDQDDKQWYSYDYKTSRFTVTDTPVLTKNYAGIGTRDRLTLAGKQAIIDVYKKTFGSDITYEYLFEDTDNKENKSKTKKSDLYSAISFESIRQASDYYLGIAFPGSLSFSQMQEYMFDGRSISQVINGRLVINAEKMQDDNLRVYVSIDENAFSQEDLQKLKSAIRTILDSGGTIIMKSDREIGLLDLNKEAELVQWISSEFDIQPDISNDNYQTFQKSEDQLDFKESTQPGKPESQEKQKLSLSEAETDDIFKKAYRLNIDKNVKSKTKSTDIQKLVDRMDVGSRFTLGEKVNSEFLWNMSVIRDNPKLMLYKIKSSERKVTLNEELEKLAKKLHLKYDKETKQISVYDYSVLIKDSEIERKQEYENLINSNLITSQELYGLAKLTAFKLSSVVSQLQQDKDLPGIIAQRLKLREGAYSDVDFTKLDSRIDVIQKITLPILMEYVKRECFGKDEYSNIRTTRKANLIFNNFNAFIELASQQISQSESISLNSKTDVKTEIETILDSEDEQEIQELFGSSAEYWMIGFRQISAFNSLSNLIKTRFSTLMNLDENGNPVINNFGMEENIDTTQAVAQILKFVQGATDINDMIRKLNIHQQSHPWLSQITDILNDKTEGQFRSQFYTNFKKYYQKYSVIYRDEDGNSRIKIINDNENYDTLIGEAQDDLYNDKFSLLNEKYKVNELVASRLKDLAMRLPRTQYFDIDLQTAQVVKEILLLLNIRTGSVQEIAASITENDVRGIAAKVSGVISYLRKNSTSYDTAMGVFDTEDFKSLSKLASKTIDFSFESMSYENGKTYYSYVMPSYLNMFISKLKGNLGRDDKNNPISYEQFFQEEFGRYTWFYKDGKYRPLWLQLLSKSEDARVVIDHKVQLNDNHVEYTDKTKTQLIQSMLSEYFYDRNGKYAWYIVPIMSNKPSEEYIKFYRFTKKDNYKKIIKESLFDTAMQEIDRIVAVRKRAKVLKDSQKINNFDGKQGQKFCFLDFLNGNKIIEDYIKSLVDRNEDDVVDDTTYSQVVSQINNLIDVYMKAEVVKVKKQWLDCGVYSIDEDGNYVGFDNIDIGSNNVEIDSNIEEFVWNNTLARINMLEMTITDLAYYKNTEDLQKRLAQLHAPGLRPDILAEFNGQRLSDGVFRTMYIKDFNDVISNVIDDLSDVFDNLIQKETNKVAKDVLKAKKEYVIKKFKEINIADAQGYSSPTSFRKKMGLFGKWGQREEEVYNKILKNQFSADDIDVAFQPLKPFVYGPTTKRGYNDVMPELKVDMQNKNSEYLIIMADALLRSQGKTNILSAIFDFMEESQGLKKNEDGTFSGEPNGKGIDTIQFESTVKTGLTGVIDLHDNKIKGYRKAKNIDDSVSDEEVIKQIFADAAYSGEGYNQDFVHEISFEYYSLQQEVPAHFKQEQQQGSQERILIFSDIPVFNQNGTENTLNVTRYVYDEELESYIKQNETLTIQQARDRYFDNIRKNIQDSIDEIVDRFGLDQYDKRKRNILLSRYLRDQIMQDARFDSDLLWACSINDDGDFNIPLSDPTQADRIQKLLNSIIKNSVNKQTIPGGPVVQVSRFGSRDLSIRFKDKDGNILMSEQEFNDFKEGKNIPENRNTNVLDKDTFKSYRKRERSSVAYFECYAPIYDDNLMKFADKDGNIDVDRIENENPKLLEMIGYRIPTESKYSMVPLKIVGFLPRNSGEGIMLPNEITTMSGSDFDIDKLYIMRYAYNISDNGRCYTPKDERSLRNNDIIDISYSVLTSEYVLEQLFTPGNFDSLKQLGYSIQAAKTAEDGLYASMFDRCMNTDDVDQIKQMGYQQKNIISTTTQIDFHQQNMVAGKLIGVFAQANVSHAFCSMHECYLNIDEKDSFSIVEDGVERRISGKTRIDNIRSFNNHLVSENLAQLLASSVDAVKDPILNLMNINMETANIVVTLLRLGFSLETVAMICSQKDLIDIVNEYSITYSDVENKPSLSRFISKKIYKMPHSYNSPRFNADDLKSTMFVPMSQQNKADFLRMVKNILNISNSFMNITHMTRYNSITQALGPSVYKTMLLKIQDNDFFSDTRIDDDTKYFLLNHPVLRAFREGQFDIERQLIGENLMQSSDDLYDLFQTYQTYIGKKEQMFKRFGDFYTSYIMAMDSGNLIQQFYMNDDKKKYIFTYLPQRIREMKKGTSNKFLQSIQVVKSKNNKNWYELRINKKNVDSNEMKAGWGDLYDQDPQTALDLVDYCFMAGSLAFTPNSFSSYIPNKVKAAMDGYINNLNQTNMVMPRNRKRMLTQFMLLNELSMNRDAVNLDQLNIRKGSDGNYYINSVLPDGSIIEDGVILGKIGKEKAFFYVTPNSVYDFKIQMIYPSEHNFYFNIDPTTDVPSEYFITSKKTTIESLLNKQSNKKDVNDDSQDSNEENEIDSETKDNLINALKTWIGAAGFDLESIKSVLENNQISKSEQMSQLSKLYKQQTRLTMMPFVRSNPNTLPMLSTFLTSLQNIDTNNIDITNLFEKVIKENYKFCV